MLPRIIIHNGVSVDGRMDWFTGDIGLYYQIASRWKVDAILTGSNTILAAPEMGGEDDVQVIPATVDPNDSRPLFVAVDSRGRVHNWNFLRKQSYWRDTIVLCSHSTPAAYFDELKKKNVKYIIAGDDHVDLRSALEELYSRYQVRVVRADSGGTLNGILLRAGWVDEVSVIINPHLVGGTTARSFFVAPDLGSSEGVVPLKLIHCEKMDGEAVWLHYEVLKDKKV